jgi:hypothetical protein
MFVAITEHTVPYFVTLCDIAQELTYVCNQSYGPLTLTKVTPKLKGRLDYACNNKDHMGSISVSMRYKDKLCNRYRKLNALIFKNSIRVSSGFPKSVEDEVKECINEEPLKDYVRMVLDAIQHWSNACIKPEDNLRIININAQTKKNPIPRYTTFCAEKLFDNVNFDRVQLPFFHEFGAITTCHVYPLKGRNCSAKLQHTGTIQYMGFQEIDMLHVFSTMIDNELL